MVRFGFFCDDKHVVDILRALAGRAKGLEIVPVNVVQKGAGGPKGSNREETINMFVNALRKTGKQDFTGPEVREVVQKMGWSPTAYSHYINGAVAFKLLRKGKKSGNTLTYHLVK